MSVHLGKMIAERLEEIGMSKAEFGRRIDTSRQNVNTLLRKKDMSVDQLLRISVVLDKDFMAELGDERERRVLKKSPPDPAPFMTISIELWSEEEAMSFLQWRKGLRK